MPILSRRAVLTLPLATLLPPSPALASANQTIQNNIAVHVDGRVVANEVSRHTVAMFGRGAGQ